MNQDTRYRYEKRIKELQSEVDRLRSYKAICTRIFYSICDMMQENKTLSQSWIVRQMGDLFK